VAKSALDTETFVKHVSPSQKDQFMRCPRQWWFRYGENFSTPPSAALFIGLSAHQALDTYFKDRIGSSHYRLDMLMDPLEESFRRANDVFWDEVAPDKAQSKLRGTLTGFHKDFAPRILPQETEVAFQYKPDGLSVPIHGRVDLLGRVPARRKDFLFEWKFTGRNVSTIKPQHLEQIQTYAMIEGTDCYAVYFVWPYQTFTPIQVPAPTEKEINRILLDYKTFVKLREFSVQTATFAGAAPGSYICTPKWCGFWDICQSYDWENLSPQEVKEKLRGIPTKLPETDEPD